MHVSSRLWGRLIFISLMQPLNALGQILFIPSASFTVLRSRHSQNAPFQISFTLPGIVTLFSGIEKGVYGRLTVFSFLQLAKASSPILFRFFERTSLVSDVQLWIARLCQYPKKGSTCLWLANRQVQALIHVHFAYRKSYKHHLKKQSTVHYGCLSDSSATAEFTDDCVPLA